MPITSPHIYVRSTDGSDASDGGTWADAKATVAGAAAIDTTTNKRVWVSNQHNESNASAQAWTFAGTLADPTWVVAVDDGGGTPTEPPTTLSTATVTTTGTSSITINGNCYLYGLTLNVATGVVNAGLTFDTGTGNVVITAENCTFKCLASGSLAIINIGATANMNSPLVQWKNVNIQFSAAGARINMLLGELIWEGGSVLSGSTALTGGLIEPSSAGELCKVRISGVDFQYLGSASYLTEAGQGGNLDVIFYNCRLPSSWTGGLVTGTLLAADRVEMYNCDSADTNYRIWIQDYFGVIRESVTKYNDAGADDGSAQGFSWEMVTTANAEFPHHALRSPEIVKWNETTTGTLTATVEIVHDGAAALTDADIWLEVMCMDPGGTPVGKWQSDCCANLNLNSNAAAQATSSAAWTGDTGTGPNGSSTWNTLKLVVSFTPKEKGYVHARVMLAKASTTVYVDPLLTIA